MKKRRLTHQQKRRIKNRQQSVIKDVSPTFSDNEFSEPMEGIVITHYGQNLHVENLDQTRSVKKCHVRSNVQPLTTGDRVIWRIHTNEKEGVVEQLLPRKSYIERPKHLGNNKIIASNIDILAIVFSSEPTPHYNLIDRYIVAAHHAKLRPVLIFNKSDLIHDSMSTYQQRFSVYKTLQYPLLFVSAETREGIDELEDILKDNISIFVGQSGVGKSSLLNTLLPNTNTKVGALSEHTSKGKHTTSAATLYHLNLGGHLIDSAGIREFGLWHLDPQIITQGFIEFAPFLHLCKFRDCTHTHESSCAILDALDQGEIKQQRYQSYLSIINSI
jgi:ribosome biogenesis GTPase / thiamine phosphate phosphatase